MKASFYSRNRSRLYKALPDGALVVFMAGVPQRRSADDFYRFYADRNFVYLTGTDRPRFVLLAEKQGGHVSERLLIEKPDVVAEVWTGRRLTEAEARSRSGIKTIEFADGFERFLHGRLTSGEVDSMWLNLDRLSPDQSVDASHALAAQVRDRYPGIAIRNAYPIVRRLRMVKAAEEIAATRRTMAITKEGIIAMMQACRPGLMEYDLLGEFNRVLISHGLLEAAFKPIVSSGPNNFYLHYENSQGPVSDGDLVLTDVGAVQDFCVNDISRVFPASGRFDDKQRTLYTLALKTCDRLIRYVKPGIKLASIAEQCRQYLYPGLCSIGLLDKRKDAIGKVSDYMWHGTTHFTGFDVHDIGEYGGRVKKGMVFTIDVGLYVREWGVGMRIEDNVLVTRDGCENLSRSIPRTIGAIEALMARTRQR